MSTYLKKINTQNTGLKVIMLIQRKFSKDTKKHYQALKLVLKLKLIIMSIIQHHLYLKNIGNTINSIIKEETYS